MSLSFETNNLELLSYFIENFELYLPRHERTQQRCNLARSTIIKHQCNSVILLLDNTATILLYLQVTSYLFQNNFLLLFLGPGINFGNESNLFSPVFDINWQWWSV